MKNVRYALFNLKRRRLRTILTIMAVMVGSFLVGIMMSLGVGLQNLVVDKIKSIQSLNEITVLVDPDVKKFLNQGTIDSIRDLPGVSKIQAFTSIGGAKIFANRALREVKILGHANDGYSDVGIVAGNSPPDLSGNTALLSTSWVSSFNADYPEELIGREVQIQGKTIDEKTFNKKLRVVGVFNQAPLLDTDLVISNSLARDLKFGDGSMASFSQLRVTVGSFKDVELVADQIANLGYRVVTLDEVLDQLVKYFRIFELALGVFGLITLGVAALGIINTMIMAIYERTREIGLMRAVGAAKRNILKLFIIEASLIGLIGGLLGMIFSWMFVSLLEYGLNKWLVQQEVISESIDIFISPWWLWLGVTIFAGLIGLLAGLYPAIRASRIDPIKALRGE